MTAPAAIPWADTRAALDALARLEGTPEFAAEDLPEHTAAIPDLLRLAGHPAVAIPGAPACRWIGQGGAEVALNRPGPAPTAPVHRGHLALPRGAQRAEGHGLPDATRRADGLALRGWPLAPPAGAPVAWNPYPWRRRARVLLPGPPHAPALRDAHGARHPATAVHTMDTALFTGTALELDPGAATTLVPDARPAPDARWETSASCLDQGRVRAEFDPAGHLVRLCIDGGFADLREPWPLAASGPMDRPDPPAEAPVPGDPPSLHHDALGATLTWQRKLRAGTLSLRVRLDPHDDHLDLTAHWRGDGPLTLRHPTRHHGVPLACGDERSRWTLPQSASAIAAPARITGLRHAALAAGDGRGLCLAFPAPTTVVAWDGDLRLELAPGGSVSYAIAAAERPPGGPTRLQLALALGAPHETTAGVPVASPIRPVLPPGVEALWLRGAPGWDGELLLSEQRLARNRVHLFCPPGRRPARAARVDARGAPLGDLEPTREDDGWILDLDPGALALVRWRCA
jgi:hypothetical protein